ncbi:MAG: cadmium-translocating P-type ATPase [Spirochaetaceae bacterium]|jgi:Cd2+/Zn2+-exporting ATPase|nr:cadmium-translocating P-type ATPase [Spirochaetaceae bacterium]
MEQVISGQRVMRLAGLDCPHCAGKIEASIGRIEGVQAAILDFVSQRLTIRAADKTKLPAIIEEASGLVREIEPGIQISVEDEKKAKNSRAGLKGKALAYRAFQAAGAAVFALGLIANFEAPLSLAVFLASYLLIGWDVLLRAARNISRGRIFDENFLMCIATIGAFAIGEYPEGAAVMLFYQVGEYFQDLAVNRSRASISALMDIKPDFAHVKKGEEIATVPPEQVIPGDLIVVKAGEKVPLDGLVVEGFSALDTSALTGEALPRDVGPGSEILSGSINKNGLLIIEVSREFGESTVSKILKLVESAGSRKSPTENFITKFARYYTPIVVFAAAALALIPPLVIEGAVFAEWINRGLVFLVVSCPCALVISIPLSFFGGIGGASKKGILVKGSGYLDALSKVDTVVFDKTGTLTSGVFKVTGVMPADGFTEDELLFCAAHGEQYSNHPIALSIRQAYGRATGRKIESGRIGSPDEIAGKGIRVRIDGRDVLIGNDSLLAAEGIVCERPAIPGTLVHLVIENTYAGCLVISDEPKPDSARAVQSLKEAGVRKVVMLTGDSKIAGEAISRELGLDAVYAELLPQDKVAQLEALEEGRETGGSLVFVGDGINDAPALARSDIGIAMGGLGSDAAIEAADVVLMTDEPSKLAGAIRIARKTKAIVWQNIIFALGVKAAILALGALGIATMWAAVFGDVGVALIAITNAMRALRIR